MADEDILLIRRDGPVLTATFNRPQRKNALLPSSLDLLLDALNDAATDDGIRVFVLTGTAGSFSSGVDVSYLNETADHPLAAMRRAGLTVLALHQLGKPTIARVEGIAAGAGCNLALACDFVVAGETASFCEIFIHRALSLDMGGSWLLPRLVGLRKAKEIAMLGPTISARAALELGLISEVVPPDDLDGVVATWAEKLVASAPLAMSMTKMLLETSHRASLEEALEDEARCQVINLASEDTQEAIQAFVEKRSPRFSGR